MLGFAWEIYAAIGLPIGRPVFGYVGASILKIFHLADAHALGLRPTTTLVRRSTLEDVFLRLTGRSLID